MELGQAAMFHCAKMYIVYMLFIISKCMKRNRLQQLSGRSQLAAIHKFLAVVYSTSNCFTLRTHLEGPVNKFLQPNHFFIIAACMMTKGPNLQHITPLANQCTFVIALSAYGNTRNIFFGYVLKTLKIADARASWVLYHFPYKAFFVMENSWWSHGSRSCA